MRIDCETTTEPDSCDEASEMFETSQGSQVGTERTTSVKPVSGRTQAEAAGVFEGASSANHGLPSPPEVLSLIALKSFQAIHPTKPEERSGFLQYLEKEREVRILDLRSGSLIITVECGSLEILEGLWKDYKTGRMNEMAQKYLVTEDILKELGLTWVKITTTILEGEYQDCLKHFMPSIGEFVTLYAADHFIVRLNQSRIMNWMRQKWRATGQYIGVNNRNGSDLRVHWERVKL